MFIIQHTNKMCSNNLNPDPQIYDKEIVTAECLASIDY